MVQASNADDELSLIGTRDHTVTNEYRIFGPPGTGKTTSLAGQVARAAARYGVESVLVTSFSRAAAAELAVREMPVPSNQIGTLHSFCWRALGKPLIAEANISEWNGEHHGHQITSVKYQDKLDGDDAVEDAFGVAHAGDGLLSELNRLRGMMRPRAYWPAQVLTFESVWSTYKRDRRLFDFCDLIDIARTELPFAPCRPSVVFADEAQDLNPLQLDLVRTWGRNAEYCVIAGDDDQTIYTWCGAIPEAVLTPEIPADHRVILRTSHRIPRRIHVAAERLIRRVSVRQEKEYVPRSEEGQYLRGFSASYKCPEYALLKALGGHLHLGQSIMVLASCSYMLQPVIALLRKEGIPFHNPFRKSDRRWNPLGMSQRRSPSHLISSLLNNNIWAHGNLSELFKQLKPELIRPEAAHLIESASPSSALTAELVREILCAEAAESLLAAESNQVALIQWLRRSVRTESQSRFAYPIAVARRRGGAALSAEPKVVVGTIHSVKGGQADVVFLFPDLSVAGATSYEHPGSSRDSVTRLFYVAMTRARHTLYLCEPASGAAVTI